MPLPLCGSSTTPITEASVKEGRHDLAMIDANRTFKVAVKRFCDACAEAATHNGFEVGDVDLIQG